MQDPHDDPDSFENTFPRYPFSELVRLALMLAGWIGRRRAAEERRDRTARPSSRRAPKRSHSKLV
ncbi:MAG: hypothetical protein ACR2PM_11340 [Hyphomicrobiales bacterium]